MYKFEIYEQVYYPARKSKLSGKGYIESSTESESKCLVLAADEEQALKFYIKNIKEEKQKVAWAKFYSNKLTAVCRHKMMGLHASRPEFF